jgi:hypothetical protein
VETTPHVDAIRGDLGAIVAGDEQATAVAERLGRALESSLQLRLLDAFGEAAVELSDQLPNGHVEVRVAGRDIQLVYVGVPEQEPPSAAASEEEGETARITLRMPDALKSRVDAAAEAEGLSVNAWLVRAANAAIDRRSTRSTVRTGKRLTGYARG